MYANRQTKNCLDKKFDSSCKKDATTISTATFNMITIITQINGKIASVYFNDTQITGKISSE